jgi:TPR repeat protein
MDKFVAFKLYSKSAAQGFVLGQFAVGVSYYNGEGVELNRGKAVYFFKSAADQNHAEAQFYLCLCYEAGNGVEENAELAFEWALKAAKNGHFFGVTFDIGDGVPVNKKNLSCTFKWQRTSNIQGRSTI